MSFKVFVLTGVYLDILADATCKQIIEEVLFAGAVYASLEAAQAAALDEIRQSVEQFNDDEPDQEQRQRVPEPEWNYSPSIGEAYPTWLWACRCGLEDADFLIREMEVQVGLQG